MTSNSLSEKTISRGQIKRYGQINRKCQMVWGRRRREQRLQKEKGRGVDHERNGERGRSSMRGEEGDRMSPKNAIYIRQNQREYKQFQGLQADDSIFNTSRSSHEYVKQQRYKIYNIYPCKWGISACILCSLDHLLTTVAEKQSAPTHANLI